MILSKKDEINTPESLKGKKIGGPKGTILHQVLVGYLGKGNLKRGRCRIYKIWDFLML